MLLGLLKHLVPLKWLLARWAWRPPAGQRNREAERRLAGNVLRLRQLIGLPDRDCLQRSLLLYRVLSRAGANPKLVVGFHRLNGQITGHAWVLVDGHPVLESKDALRQFSSAMAFGAAGEILPTVDL